MKIEICQKCKKEFDESEICKYWGGQLYAGFCYICLECFDLAHDLETDIRVREVLDK